MQVQCAVMQAEQVFSFQWWKEVLEEVTPYKFDSEESFRMVLECGEWHQLLQLIDVITLALNKALQPDLVVNVFEHETYDYDLYLQVVAVREDGVCITYNHNRGTTFLAYKLPSEFDSFLDFQAFVFGIYTDLLHCYRSSVWAANGKSRRFGL